MSKRFQKVVTRSATALVLCLAMTAAGEKTWADEAGQAPTNSAPATRKVWWTKAWAPTNTPLRGIITGAGGSDAFCTRNGLARVTPDWVVWREEVDFFDLEGLAGELGHPELTNAPVIVVGLSIGGYRAITFTIEHADRVVAVLPMQPVIRFLNQGQQTDIEWGNSLKNHRGLGHRGYNQGLQTDNARKGGDVSRMLGVPMFLQVAADDDLLGTAMAYRFFGYGRREGAPWTFFCKPDGGHGAGLNMQVVEPWLEAVIAQRLPPDVDLFKGRPTLKPIVMDTAWFGNMQTLEVAESAKYAGERPKASWLPDKAAAETWKKQAKGMPYEVTDVSLRQPSGLISNLVVKAIASSAMLKDEVWQIVGNLKEGDTFCTIPGTWAYTRVAGKVPEVVRGCDWIRPDMAAVSFTNEPLLEFTVSDDAVVYVAHDERIVTKPAWLAEWKDTGEFLRGGILGNEDRLRLFSKPFPKGAKVALGPNGERPKGAKGQPEGWMYMTMAKRAGEAQAGNR